MENIPTQAWKRGIAYDDYMKMISNLVTNNATSGSNQDEALVNYTKLNFSRMKRLNKTVVADTDLTNAIRNVGYNMRWIVLTEAWCGDAAQNIPYIAKIALACTNVELRCVLRDENPEFMNQHLTNGGKSIPKLVIFNADTMEELGEWGPRPAEIQKTVTDYHRKPEPKLPFAEFAEIIQKWYNTDKNNSLNNELLTIFKGLK